MWLGLTYGVVRTSFGAVSRSRDRQLFGLTEELEDVVREALRGGSASVRARVATEEGEGAEDEIEARRRARERSR
jgi:hypothetical protein